MKNLCDLWANVGRCGANLGVTGAGCSGGRVGLPCCLAHAPHCGGGGVPRDTVAVVVRMARRAVLPVAGVEPAWWPCCVDVKIACVFVLTIL